MSRHLILIVFLLLSIRLWAGSADRVQDPFNGLSVRLEATVYVEQGEQQKVEITAPPQTLERIITEVKDSVLIIRYNRSISSSSKNTVPVSIRIVMPKIQSLSLSGNGQVFCEKSIQSPELKLSVSGSGNMKINSIQTQMLKVSLSGSGNIKLAEPCEVLSTSVSISGSGFFIAEHLSAEEADVHITGSGGDCSLTVTRSLHVGIIGSGEVHYKGNPVVTSSIVGSGSVLQIK